jgi:hypothetical protein
MGCTTPKCGVYGIRNNSSETVSLCSGVDFAFLLIFAGVGSRWDLRFDGVKDVGGVVVELNCELKPTMLCGMTAICENRC